MALTAVSLITALLLGVASAFQDTSPFFAFSSSGDLQPKFDDFAPQIVTSLRLQEQLGAILDECSATTYVLVSQPGVNKQDFSHRNTAPHLRRWLGGDDEESKSSIVIPEVAGRIDVDDLSRRLQEQCKAVATRIRPNDGVIEIKEAPRRIILVDFPSIPLHQGERAGSLSKHDSLLNAIVAEIRDPRYTVIYATSPPSEPIPSGPHHSAQVYEMDDPYRSTLHTELKRDVEAHATNRTSDVPLFEKYQYLSPGIFMGLTVSITLLLILYVAITAVSSIEVSYFAFSKEMGPSAQKKQG